MKFLEYTPLARINSFLDSLDFGDHALHGFLEAYSCKAAGVDKKLSRSVEQEVVEALAASPSDLAASPVGPLSSSASRKTLVYLILTLNHAHPDYDFSTLRSHHFSREVGLDGVRNQVEQLLGAEAGKVWEERGGNEDRFTDCLWSAIDEVIQLSEAEVYRYSTEVDEAIFSDRTSIWSFNFFFYNRKLKRILYFTCRCQSKLMAPGEDEEGELPSEDARSDGFGDMADDMDL